MRPSAKCVESSWPYRAASVSKLPVCSGAAEAVKAFKRLGYEEEKRGAPYVRLVASGRTSLSVPQHRTLAKGTLCHLIKNSGFTVEQFKNAL